MTGRRRWLRWVLLPLLIAHAPLAAQDVHGLSDAHSKIGHGRAAISIDSTPSGFLRAAINGSARFGDVREAVLAGYRRIGPDFPGMGEHWISLGLLMSATLDPQRPTFLSYAVIAGEQRLVGVAYAIPLSGDAAAPGWPAGIEAWHDHSRSVEDEVLLTQAGLHSHERVPRARLAMLHAWVWLENPAGPFAKENWALPFARAGFAPPTREERQAGRALSLATHAEYYKSLLDRFQALGADERSSVAALVQEYGRRVENFVVAQQGAALDDENLAQLAGWWSELWNRAERMVSRDAVLALRALRGEDAAIDAR